MKVAHKIFLIISAICLFIIIDKITFCLTSDSNYSNIIYSIQNEFEQDLGKLHYDLKSIIIGILGGMSAFLIDLYHKYDRKNYLEKKEYGSAEWGKYKDIKPLIDRAENKNIIFSQTEKMSIDSRKTKKNNNVLVIGGSGSGKSRFFVKPNIMQMNSNYVITDPKGELLHSMGKMLQENEYTIKVFNLIDFVQSDKYNFFNYIKDEKDILKLTTNIIANTNSPQSKSAGDFWEKAESALMQALISYVFFEGLEEERNMNTVMELIRLADVKEEDEDYEDPLDLLFKELREENPNHFAVKQYDIYKLASGKTAKSILVSLGVRLAPYNIESVIDLTSTDTLELEYMGDKKTALFIVTSDSDTSLNFLTAIMYQQLFDLLFYRADNFYNGELPFPIMFILDEFANIGQIPNFEIYCSTMRSRRISVNVIIQNLAQLKNLYKESWETITGNCDSLLFLGGKEQSTLKYISDSIGKTTIDYRSISETKGNNGSYSIGNQIIGRNLMTADEISLLKSNECILSIRGIKPFLSKKYELEKHKNYSLIEDGKGENIFMNQRKSFKEKILEEIENISEIEELEIKMEV